MTSFLTIPHGQNATHAGKHCQAGFAYAVFPSLSRVLSKSCPALKKQPDADLAAQYNISDVNQ